MIKENKPIKCIEGYEKKYNYDVLYELLDEFFKNDDQSMDVDHFMELLKDVYEK